MTMQISTYFHAYILLTDLYMISWENAGLSLAAKVTDETENFYGLCPKHEINRRNSHSLFFAWKKLILLMGNLFVILKLSELPELEPCILAAFCP